MNIEGGVRQRKSGEMESTVKTGMKRFESTMNQSVFKFRSMPTKAKLLVFMSGVFSLCFYFYLGSWLYSSSGTDADAKRLETLLNSDKCPACIGHSACYLFYYDAITFSGMSKFRALDMLNSKNVHFAKIGNDQDVVLKKLQSDEEMRKVDEAICSDAKRTGDCDVARVFPHTDTVYPYQTKAIDPVVLKKYGAFMFHCPSYRLLDRMWTHFQEFKKRDKIFISDKTQVIYMSMVNPEPLLLQTFPQREGWPFPEYHGACGRVLVVEYTGEPLTNYFNHPFGFRAGLAYELMKIADTLTNKADFVLYLTDVSYENFAVDSSGKVTVIDLEHIIVVDRVAIKARARKGWDENHESMFSNCEEGKNCLDFSADDLCAHYNSDHNYNAICRNLLSSYANEEGMKGGLLHNMPEEAEDYWDLKNLLNECTKPSSPGGRWKAKDKIMEALRALANGDKEHLKTLKGKERNQIKDSQKFGQRDTDV